MQEQVQILQINNVSRLNGTTLEFVSGEDLNGTACVRYANTETCLAPTFAEGKATYNLTTGSNIEIVATNEEEFDFANGKYALGGTQEDMPGVLNDDVSATISLPDLSKETTTKAAVTIKLNTDKFITGDADKLEDLYLVEEGNAKTTVAVKDGKFVMPGRAAFVSATFEKAPANPKTIDNLGKYIVLSSIALIGLLTIVVVNKKSKANK